MTGDDRQFKVLFLPLGQMGDDLRFPKGHISEIWPNTG